jgi:hypothetical protein
MLPPALAVLTRAIKCTAVLLFVALFIVACDTPPTELDPEIRLAPAPGSRALVNPLDPTICGTGKKTIEVEVFLDPDPAGDPVPAAGVVVTAIKPVAVEDGGGLVCWNTTNAQGIARLFNASKDDELILIARDELGYAGVNSEWPYQEFIPPLIPTDLTGYHSAPADPAGTFRTIPMLAYGPDCIAVDYTNQELMNAVASPCVVGGPGLDATFVFSQDNSDRHQVINPQLCFLTDDPCNDPTTDLSGALIAALYRVDCSTQYVPWLVSDCDNVKDAALVQAGDTTNSDGTVGPEGLSVIQNDGSDTTWVEVIFESDGRTVVGSLDAICDANGCDTSEVYGYPAICYLPPENVFIEGTEYPAQPLEDLSEPSGSAALDIRYLSYGYTFEMTEQVGGGFNSSFLTPEYDAIAVVLQAIKNADGPVGGTVTLKYTPFGVSYTRKIDVAYGVDGDGDCFVDGAGASGSGLVGDAEVLIDTCRQIDPDTETFEFFVEFRSLPFDEDHPAEEVTVHVSSDGDNLDTARNDLTSAGLLVPPLLDDVTLTADGYCRWDRKNVESRWRGF